MVDLKLECLASDDVKHTADLECIVLHGKNIITAADEGRVKIWSSSDLSLITEFKAHDYAILHLLIIGDTLYTGSVDQTIKAWQIDTWKNKGTFTGHETSIHRLATDGEHLFSGDDQGEIRQWTKDGKLLLIYALIEEVWDLYVKRNLIYTVRDKDMIVAEMTGESEKYSIVFAHPGRSPLFLRDNILALTDRSGLQLNIFESEKPYSLKHTLKGHEMIITAVSGLSHYLASSGYDQKLLLWDINTGNYVASTTVPSVPNAMAIANDGSIFIGGSDGFLAKYKTSGLT